MLSDQELLRRIVALEEERDRLDPDEKYGPFTVPERPAARRDRLPPEAERRLERIMFRLRNLYSIEDQRGGQAALERQTSE